MLRKEFEILSSMVVINFGCESSFFYLFFSWFLDLFPLLGGFSLISWLSSHVFFSVAYRKLALVGVMICCFVLEV